MQPSLFNTHASFTLFFLICLLNSPALCQKPGDEITARMEGHVHKPRQLNATAEHISSLTLPAGFVIEKWADNLEAPRMLTVNGNNLYVSVPKKGQVLLFKDATQQSTKPVVVMQQDKVHGMAIHDNQFYAITVTEVFRAPIQADGTLGEAEKIIENLPDGGQHPNRTLYFGPDNMLYITVGSTCNACDEPNKENATILRFKPDGSERTIFAKGLRNTIGIDWHPETQQLFGMDHGIDWLGDEVQQEELNRIEEGKHYGWPYIYADGKYNPADVPEEGFDAFKQKVSMPELLFEAHSAPMNLLFYTGNQFPAEYQNDAFVSMHGSWNRKDPSGYKIVRVHFENGKPVSQEDFLTGFLLEDGSSQFGRPCGLAQLPDGSLLLSDDGAGALYKISYQDN